jgi:predicted AAA+ superfamily ATPase
MRATIERLVADFDPSALPAPTPREITLPGLPTKVDTLVGMRRSGKTWFAYQLIREAVRNGIEPECLLYINFEDERLLPMTAADLREIPEALYRRYPSAQDRKCWFFFDEIQNVPGWEMFVRRLLDSLKARIVLTGSSAKLLSREIATSLRGRSLATELLPFSFRELLIHRGVPLPERWPVPERQRSLLSHHLRSYLATGGFPEVVDLEPELRARILIDYVDIVLFRDVVERHGVTNVAALRYLTRCLLRSPAGLFSINKLYNDLRSQGLRVGKDTLYEYLSYLEDAYLLFDVQLHSESERQRMVNPRKCYLVDPALSPAVSFAATSDIGHLLENTVYLELRRRGYTCRYLRTSKGHVVDLLALKPGGKNHLVQVCTDLSASPETRHRELRACVEGVRQLAMNQATIVTLENEENLSLENVEIRVVPAWRWLVENQNIP